MFTSDLCHFVIIHLTEIEMTSETQTRKSDAARHSVFPCVDAPIHEHVIWCLSWKDAVSASNETCAYEIVVQYCNVFWFV